MASEIARTVAEGGAKTGLRWIEYAEGRADIVAADGLIWGWIEPVCAGSRGCVIDPVRRSQCRMQDHPTSEAARAWVEAEVASRSTTPTDPDPAARARVGGV